MSWNCRTAQIVLLALVATKCASYSAGAAEATLSPCKPEVWQKAIDKFGASDAKTPPPKDAVLFVGSSSIVAWDLKKSFPEITTINRGFGGSQLCHSVHFADELAVKHKPRQVVLYAGDNDIKAGKTAEQVHGDFRAFVAKVRKGLPKTPIVYIAIKPSIARWNLRETMQAANRLIAADCEKDESLQFVDVWQPMLGDDGRPRPELFRNDGLHLNAAGYQVWNDLVRPLLESGKDK
jgi:lysophospholipase L1-like esterase